MENSENVQLSERAEMVHTDDNMDGTEELCTMGRTLCRSGGQINTDVGRERSWWKAD